MFFNLLKRGEMQIILVRLFLEKFWDGICNFGIFFSMKTKIGNIIRINTKYMIEFNFRKRKTYKWIVIFLDQEHIPQCTTWRGYQTRTCHQGTYR